jgi:chromosome segregation ATPase
MKKTPALKKAYQIEQQVRLQIVELQSELSSLSVQKESLDRDIQAASSALSDIGTRKRELEVAISEVFDASVEVKQASNELLVETVDTLRRGRELVGSMKHGLGELENRVNEAMVGLKRVQQEKEQALGEIEQGMRELKQRKRELDAFEDFIRDVYDRELFPLAAFNL